MAWFGDSFERGAHLTVAERRARALEAAEKIARKGGRALTPVGPLDGNTLVRTFWGRAWCKNLESYGDYANRIARGRSYARHGAILDLQLTRGKIRGLVSGTSTYEVEITIRSLESRRWKQIAIDCTGQVDSLVDLLRGKLSMQVMEVITQKERGLFPAPREISFACSCPDWADMCKHVAAVLYGVGMRLDQQPDLLFALRAVDQGDLISEAAGGPALARRRSSGRKVIEGANLAALFDIEVEETVAASPPPARPDGPKKTAEEDGDRRAALAAETARKGDSTEKTGPTPRARPAKQSQQSQQIKQGGQVKQAKTPAKPSTTRTQARHGGRRP